MFALLEAPAFGWTHPLILVTAVAGLVALVWFGLSRRRSAAPVLAPFLVANRAFLGRSLIALALAVVGNLWLMGLNADNPVAAAAAPLLMIGVGMEAPFGITDGQAMAAMLDRDGRRDVTVHAAEPSAGRPVTVTVPAHGDQVRWEPRRHRRGHLRPTHAPIAGNWTVNGLGTGQVKCRHSAGRSCDRPTEEG
ncbi:hypothetical protein ACNF49_40505 [Actinomadura sp. ATCC 39365]